MPGAYRSATEYVSTKRPPHSTVMPMLKSLLRQERGRSSSWARVCPTHQSPRAPSGGMTSTRKTRALISNPMTASPARCGSVSGYWLITMTSSTVAAAGTESMGESVSHRASAAYPSNAPAPNTNRSNATSRVGRRRRFAVASTMAALPRPDRSVTRRPSAVGTTGPDIEARWEDGSAPRVVDRVSVG